MHACFGFSSAPQHIPCDQRSRIHPFYDDPIQTTQARVEKYHLINPTALNLHNSLRADEPNDSTKRMRRRERLRRGGFLAARGDMSFLDEDELFWSHENRITSNSFIARPSPDSFSDSACN